MQRFFIALLLLLMLGTVALAQGTVTPTAPDTTGSDDTTIESALEDFGTRLSNLSENEIAQVVTIVGGIILLVFGWRIYNLIIWLSGALTGAAIAVVLVNSTDTIAVIAAILIGGLVGAALAILLYYLAVFVIGAYVGAAIAVQLGIALNLDVDPVLVLVGGGLFGGLLLLALSMEFLIFLSSIVGGQLLALGLGLDFVWMVVFIVAGIVIQLILARRLGYKIRRRPSRRMLWREA